MVKVRALKLSAYVEELVKEDFPCGLFEDIDGIDLELCLHQDYLYMLRHKNKTQVPISGNSAASLSSDASQTSKNSSSATGYCWDDRPLRPQDIIL